MEPDQSREFIEGSTDEEIGPVDVRIFAVCKQVYGQNVFRIELVGPEYLNLPSPMFRTGFQPTNQDLISKPKKVELQLFSGRRYEWALKRVCKELADRAKLNEIRIDAHGSVGLGADADKVMDDLFEILTDSRGVESVVFNDAWEHDTEVRILGTRAQKDRVTQIMTTLN